MQTLINEMRLEPFNKANCIAMLNTLYPPTTVSAPTRQLTVAVLTSQRSGFFRYITAVEKNGKSILTTLENQGQRPGDTNGWPAVRDIVDKYLRTSGAVIEECVEVNGLEYFEPEAEAFRRSERRADSGVSFSSGDRPSTGDSGSTKPRLSLDKPLPKSPPSAAETEPLPPTFKRKGTRLERIARELRNLRNRNDVREMPGSRHEGDGDSVDLKPRSLRKMQSTSSIRARTPMHSRSGSDESQKDFDFDAKRQRMILEAQKEKENRVPRAHIPVMVGRGFDLDA